VFEEETPLTWQRTPSHAAVYGADGSEIGTVESVLGDEQEDIFHGLALRRGGGEGGGVVELPAARIKKISASGVVTDLYPADAARLAPYREH
jgi:sporulation protein YlmC with PRC-barrel domain